MAVNDAPRAWPIWTPGLQLAGIIKGLTKHCFTQNIKVSQDILVEINMSLVMRKPGFCICENNDADQLRGIRVADQRLCFRYIASTIPLLPKYKISSL